MNPRKLTQAEQQQIMEYFQKLGIDPKNIVFWDASEKSQAKESPKQSQEKPIDKLAAIDLEIQRLQDLRTQLQKEKESEVLVHIWIGPYSPILRIKDKDKFYVLTKAGLLEADAPVTKALEIHKFKNLDSALAFVRKF